MYRSAVVLFLLIGFTAIGQDAEVISPIKNLFDGMRLGNAMLIESAFAPNATLETYSVNEAGLTERRQTSAVDFVQAAGQPHDPIWNEVIWSYDVRRDGPLATVWTEYSFYLGKQLSHCGVNAFQLVLDANAWKIARITDTRRTDNCRETEQEESVENNVQYEIDQSVWRPFQEAYASFDHEKMNGLHSDDIVRANDWKIRVGDEYKQGNAKRYEEARIRGDQRTIDFYFDSRKASDTHAVETGYFKVTSTRENNTRYFYGYFHVILKKEGGTWKIIYDWDTDKINNVKINAQSMAGLTKF